MNQAVQDALIEAQVEEIKSRAHDPGVSVFLSGDPEIDNAMAVPATFTTTAADRVVIYHTETGEPREILVNMLAKTLRKRTPDGKPAFSMSPGKAYKRGTFKCELHADHPMWRTVDRDEVGLAGIYCESGHLASAFHVRRHMEHKHGDEAKVLAEYRAQSEKAETTRLMQEQTAAMLKLLERQIPAPAPPVEGMGRERRRGEV